MSQLSISMLNTTVIATMKIWLACIQAMTLLIDAWRRTMPRVLGGTAPRSPARPGREEAPRLAANEDVDPETNAAPPRLAANEDVDPETNVAPPRLAA